MQTAIRHSQRPLYSMLRGLASLASLAVILCCGWFATMELILRHEDYLSRFLVAAAIVAQGALTLVVLEDLIPAAPFRWPLAAGGLATGLVGWWIVAEDLARPGLPARPHFEGYLLIIGVALIAYGVLTIVAMLSRRQP